MDGCWRISGCLFPRLEKMGGFWPPARPFFVPFRSTQTLPAKFYPGRTKYRSFVSNEFSFWIHYFPPFFPLPFLFRSIVVRFVSRESVWGSIIIIIIVATVCSGRDSFCLEFVFFLEIDIRHFRSLYGRNIWFFGFLYKFLAMPDWVFIIVHFIFDV